MPAARPHASGSKRAPDILATAMASMDPIIQGRGRCSAAKTAPEAMQVASALATGATRERFGKRDWLRRCGKRYNFMLYRPRLLVISRAGRPDFRPGSSVGRAED